MLAGITNANEQRPTSAGKSFETDVAAAKNASWTRVSNLHQARLTIIGTVVVVAAIVLCLGFFVNWGLAALSVIILVPGAISAFPIRTPCLTRSAARPSAGASDYG